MPKGSKSMRKRPTKAQIRELLKNETFQWLLERLAFEMNQIDTVRNITPENLNNQLAARLAIEIIENWLGELWELGELRELQQESKKEEDRIIKSLRELKQEY